jgi:predicted enzyme related to lactoylglutathione lyase
MFTDVYHIGYQTDDMTSAIAFYKATFDATLKQEITNPGVNRMAFLRAGNTEIELIEPADKSRLGGRTGLILDHIGYVVPDIDASMAVLAARGIKFEAEKPRINPEGARLIYIDSSTVQGTRIHLTERPK